MQPKLLQARAYLGFSSMALRQFSMASLQRLRFYSVEPRLLQATTLNLSSSMARLQLIMASSYRLSSLRVNPRLMKVVGSFESIYIARRQLEMASSYRFSSFRVQPRLLNASTNLGSNSMAALYSRIASSSFLSTLSFSPLLNSFLAFFLLAQLASFITLQGKTGNFTDPILAICVKIFSTVNRKLFYFVCIYFFQSQRLTFLTQQSSFRRKIQARFWQSPDAQQLVLDSSSLVAKTTTSSSTSSSADFKASLSSICTYSYLFFIASIDLIMVLLQSQIYFLQDKDCRTLLGLRFSQKMFTKEGPPSCLIYDQQNTLPDRVTSTACRSQPPTSHFLLIILCAKESFDIRSFSLSQFNISSQPFFMYIQYFLPFYLYPSQQIKPNFVFLPIGITLFHLKLNFNN